MVPRRVPEARDSISVLGAGPLLTGCEKTILPQQKNVSAGCSKRPFSKAAASEETRRTLRYVEPLSDARTPLADFFSILLSELCTGPREYPDGWFDPS